MVKLKEEEQIKNQVLLLAKRNISAIGVFIKLVDYMVVGTQIGIILESSNIVLFDMVKDGKKNGLVTEVTFDESSLVFSPPESDFH